MREGARPDSPTLIVLDSVGEALDFERAFFTQRFRNFDGVLPGLFVREVFGEENVGNVFARRTTVVLDGLREVPVGLSVVAHNIILEEGSDGS